MTAEAQVRPAVTEPDSLNIADGPAAFEPNGKVLMMASPGFGPPPSTFLEWNGEELHKVAPSPNAANDASFYGVFLVLPTGQILMTDFFFVQVCDPTGHYNPDWAPRIASAPSTVRRGGTYEISGYGFNGMSQGAAYGDDHQTATNFPLVRITNLGERPCLLQPHPQFQQHGRRNAQACLGALRRTGRERGASELVVVTNGIPSTPVAVFVRSADD